MVLFFVFFFFQAEDGIRDFHVTGVQTCALPILEGEVPPADAVSTLADKRLEVVRATIKKSKIDTARLLEDKRPPEIAKDDAPQVRFELAESENSGRPGRKAELPRLSDASPPSAR